MESTRRQRICARHRDVGDHVDADDASGVGEAHVPVHDDGLIRWKQERLAHHHAYFALLDKSFTRWKDVMVARRQRRQRVIAACRVGAKFFQRLYWDQWTATIAHRHAAREAASRILHAVSIKIRRQTAWIWWKQTTVASRRVEQKTLSLVDEITAEQRIEVRGVRLQKKPQSAIATHPSFPTPVETDKVDQQLRTKRADALKHVTVYYTQRHYFQLWRAAACFIAKAISTHLGDKADTFRLGSGWRRWRRGFATRSTYRTASRQAVFFLYYHLTKSSIAQLRRFAARQRQERGVVVVLANRVRRRQLSSAFARWRQRLNTKLVLAEWRAVVREASSRHLNPQLRVVYDIVRGLDSSRLLYNCFSVWLHQSTRKRQIRALARAMDGPVFRTSLVSAFRLWQRRTLTQKQLEDRLKTRDRARLLAVWRVWTQFAIEKDTREQQRRTATRFWYYRTLRRSLTAWQALRARQDEVDNTVNSMAQAIAVRRKREIFGQWASWCARRQRRRDATLVAQHHHDQVTMRNVVRVLGTIRQEAQQRKDLAEYHAQKTARKKLQIAFAIWKTLHTHEQQRDRQLQRILSAHAHARSVRTKRLVFVALDDYAKSKQSKRLVSAHARGHFQSYLLHNAFAQWVTSVAQLKWEHIFNQRARHFQHQKLAAKCFRQWKTNVLAIRQYREKTRLALHHWKQVRERVAFDGWKRYVAAKRRQRQRMHDALEFRHRAHIRDGLSHWIAGATQLEQQRSRRTVTMQATHTERVWRRVRQIARHWRFVTQRNKVRTTKRQELPLQVRRNNLLPRAFVDDTSQVYHDVRISADTYRLDRAVPAARASQAHHHLSRGSELSEFVMLPRNRPRPRRPIELILENDLQEAVVDEPEEEDVYRTVDTVNRHYGFQFPVAPTRILDERTDLQRPVHDSIQGRTDILLSSCQGSAPIIPSADILQENASTVDELEHRLRHWQSHQQRLAQLQHSLDEFRQLLHQASTEGNLTQHELEFMQTRLRTMEQQEAASRQRWHASRPEILSLAERIKLLRVVTTVAA